VFLRLVAKMSDQIFEQRIEIKLLGEIREECKWNLCNALRGLWGRSY
jgi:hypothetical protein